MSDFDWYDNDRDRLRVTREFGGRTITVNETYDGSDHKAAVRVPTDPAERHALTEAIHGRKIAAIVYEEGLPTTSVDDEFADTETVRRALLYNAAVLRACEARDAEEASRAAEIDAAEAAQEADRLEGIAALTRAMNKSEAGPFAEWAASLYDSGVRYIEEGDR